MSSGLTRSSLLVQVGLGLPKELCRSLGSAGRQAAAFPGPLQRDWVMQHQEKALKSAALAGRLLSAESKPGAQCWGGEEELFLL